MKENFDIEKEIIEMIRSSLKNKESLDRYPYVKYRKGASKSQGVFCPDAYIPNGCKELDIPPECIIEIKTCLMPDTIPMFRNIFDTCIQEERIMIQNFMLVYGNSDKLFDSYVEKLKNDYEGDGFLIVSYEELKSRYNKIKNENVGNAEIDWESSREDIIRDARNKFNRGKNTFFLGAGVGASKGSISSSLTVAMRKLVTYST